MDAPRGPRALLLLGPTGSGKSEHAMRLAEELPVEIVSVDSAQVYRGMDIGTAKPDAAERACVPHHLLDIREPEESFSAGEFRADALRLIEEITARGRVPLLVGGTMLYFRALLHGIAPLPRADEALRRRIDERAEERGWPALHAELATRDPASAARIHPNDAQRIQRALEILELTGTTREALWRSEEAPAEGRQPWLAAFSFEPGDREELHRRIEHRFHAMLDAGLVDEVRRLHARPGLTAEHPAMRAVGYRQLWDFCDGEASLDAAVAAAIAATRQLARRQYTWLRGSLLTPARRTLRLDPLDGKAYELFRAAAFQCVHSIR